LSVNVVLENDDVVVLGPPEVIELAIDIGPKGDRGSIWYTGEGDPNINTVVFQESQPRIGDFYIDVENGESYGLVYQYQVTPGGNQWEESLEFQTIVQQYLSSNPELIPAYLTEEEATGLYLSLSSASSTYLTQTDASSTYLTQTDATNQYRPNKLQIKEITEENYSLIVEDVNCLLSFNTSASVSVFIPAAEDLDFEIGSIIDVLQYGTGSVNFFGDAGVILNANPGNSLSGQWAQGRLIKIEEDLWVLSGNIS
jgi:hypothetical protein